MRIVQINSVCDIGSTGRIMADLARKASAKGNETICAYGRYKSDATDIKTVRIGTSKDILLHLIATRIFDMHGLASKKATKFFLEQIDEFHPDMFHLHNLHGYYINYPLLFDYIKKNDIKVRWTLHDSWAFTGHCAGPVYYNCLKYKESCADCPQRKGYPKSLIFCNSERNFQLKKDAFLGVKDMEIITPSSWLAGIVRESFLGCYQISVLHNKIDTKIFKPMNSDFRKQYNIEGKKMYLGVAFSWHDDKIASFASIASKLYDDEVLVLVGVTNKERRLIGSGNLIGIEKTDSKVYLAKIYSAADVLINPSDKSENYPTVNLEAQACGTYVVTYDSGGSAETIQPNMGCAVPYGDVDALLAKAREFVGEKGFVALC